MKIDLFVDLNTEDETGLPWMYVDQASDPPLSYLAGLSSSALAPPSLLPKSSMSPTTAWYTFDPYLAQ
jgi:hypothetical protein